VHIFILYLTLNGQNHNVICAVLRSVAVLHLHSTWICNVWDDGAPCSLHGRSHACARSLPYASRTIRMHSRWKCVCVRVCACVHLCLCVRVYACVACMYVCMCAHIYAPMSVCKFICMVCLYVSLFVGMLIYLIVFMNRKGGHLKKTWRIGWSIWWSIQHSYHGAFKIRSIQDASSLICRIMFHVCESKGGGPLKRGSRIWWSTCYMLEYRWSIMYSSIFANQKGGRPWKDVCMYVCMHSLYECIYVCVCMYEFMYVCVCMNLNTYVCVYIHGCTPRWVCAHPRRLGTQTQKKSRSQAILKCCFLPLTCTPSCTYVSLVCEYICESCMWVHMWVLYVST